jgi:uncharacterized protein (TIGR02246 family)
MKPNDEEHIRDLLAGYQRALNSSSVEEALALYAPDGVFMPQHGPSSVGLEAIRAAYGAVFKAIQLTVEFAIAEVRVLAPEWALARTNSAGTTLDHATGQTRPEANQELFVFQKVGADWKIARYCFCTTNPPR